MSAFIDLQKNLSKEKLFPCINLIGVNGNDVTELQFISETKESSQLLN